MTSRSAHASLTYFVGTFLALTGKEAYGDAKRFMGDREYMLMVDACDSQGYEGMPRPPYDGGRLASWIKETFSQPLKQAVSELSGVSLEDSDLEEILDQTVELQENIPEMAYEELADWVQDS